MRRLPAARVTERGVIVGQKGLDASLQAHYAGHLAVFGWGEVAARKAQLSLLAPSKAGQAPSHPLGREQCVCVFQRCVHGTVGRPCSRHGAA